MTKLQALFKIFCNRLGIKQATSYDDIDGLFIDRNSMLVAYPYAIRQVTNRYGGVKHPIVHGRMSYKQIMRYMAYTLQAMDNELTIAELSKLALSARNEHIAAKFYFAANAIEFSRDMQKTYALYITDNDNVSIIYSGTFNQCWDYKEKNKSLTIVKHAIISDKVVI